MYLQHGFRQSIITCCLVFVLSQIANAEVKEPTCRSKFGRYQKSDFGRHACAWCYFFLFQSQNKSLLPSPDHYLIVQHNGTGFPLGTRLVPDAENYTARTNICGTLSDSDECHRWRLCCKEATDCCARQIRNDVINSTCKGTWDGYGCWGGGVPGENSYISCPSFLKFSVPTRLAVKSCEIDGTWKRKENHEWTDYTPCLNFEELKISIYISLGCQIASITLLLPALIIFVQYKSLRKQHRIRLHMNFFLSFMCSGICVVMWNMLVTYDRLTTAAVSETVLYGNSGWCKFLSFFKLYFTSTNYAWMFCEGLYLYRLIVNAFSPPKRLLPLYIAGWGIPLAFSITYAVLRAFTANESCWAISAGESEWILYAPNLTCLVANLFFLCSILRILLTQLQAHPNEPSNFRRALKATFFLIPLFGIQLVVTIYRLPPENPGAMHYERFSEFITNSQGFFVALIFCFCNGEVASHIKRTFRRVCQDKFSNTSRYNGTLTLNFNSGVSKKYHGDCSRPSSSDGCTKGMISDNTLLTTQSQL